MKADFRKELDELENLLVTKTNELEDANEANFLLSEKINEMTALNEQIDADLTETLEEIELKHNEIEELQLINKELNEKIVRDQEERNVSHGNKDDKMGLMMKNQGLREENDAMSVSTYRQNFLGKQSDLVDTDRMSTLSGTHV